jgi:hypothetical protein
MSIDRAELGLPTARALAAVYTREVRIGTHRIWESQLDLEHLPTLHKIL